MAEWSSCCETACPSKQRQHGPRTSRCDALWTYQTFEAECVAVSWHLHKLGHLGRFRPLITIDQQKRCWKCCCVTAWDQRQKRHCSEANYPWFLEDKASELLLRVWDCTALVVRPQIKVSPQPLIYRPSQQMVLYNGSTKATNQILLQTKYRPLSTLLFLSLIHWLV